MIDEIELYGWLNIHVGLLIWHLSHHSEVGRVMVMVHMVMIVSLVIQICEIWYDI